MTTFQLARLKLIADEISLLAEEIGSEDFILIGADRSYVSVHFGDMNIYKFSHENEYTFKRTANSKKDEGYQE